MDAVTNVTNTTTAETTNSNGGTTMPATETTKTNRTRSKAHNNKVVAEKLGRIIVNAQKNKVGSPELPTKPIPATSRKKYSEKINNFLTDAKKACDGEKKITAAVEGFLAREKYNSQTKLTEFLKELQGVALWPAGKKPVSPASFFGKKSAWSISEDRKFFVKGKTGEKCRYDIVLFLHSLWKRLANQRAKDKTNASVKISLNLEEAIALNNAITELQKYALTSKDTMLQELNSALVAARTASGLSEKVTKQLES